MGSLVSSVGDLFGLGPASIQARASRDAANTAANAQLEAARIAAEAQKFRPVGITSRFGSSQFQMSPEGYLQGASYQLSPELQAIQDYVMGQTRTSLEDVSNAQNIGRSYMGDSQGAPVQALGQQFMGSTVGQPITALGQQFMGSNVGQPLTSLGQGYLALSPEQAAADWMAKQQAVLQPSRETALSNIRNSLFQTGRAGLSTAQGGTLGAANPEMQAYYNALAQQDAQLAAQAAEQGRAQQQFGAGLYQTGAGLTQAQQLAGAGLYGTGTGLTQAQQLAGAGLYGTGIGLTQQGIGFGQGLLSSAYSPLQTGLGFGATIEQLGQQPLDIGSMLGGRSAQYGSNVGQSLLTGGLAAAKTLQPAMSTSPLAAGLFGLGQSSLGTAADKAFGNWVSGLWGGGNTLNSDEEALAYYMGQ